MFIGRSRICRTRMVPLSQEASDQIPDALTQEHAGPQRTGDSMRMPGGCFVGHASIARWSFQNPQDVGHGTETEEIWLSIKKRLPPRPRYLAPLGDQLRALRCCCLADSYQAFVL